MGGAGRADSLEGGGDGSAGGDAPASAPPPAPEPCRLLQLPRALQLQIVLALGDPTRLFATCAALRALGADKGARLQWLLAHRPRPRPLPFAVASFRVLADAPFEEALELMVAADYALLPGRGDGDRRRNAQRYGAAPRRRGEAICACAAGVAGAHAHAGQPAGAAAPLLARPRLPTARPSHRTRARARARVAGPCTPRSPSRRRCA
ncbi:MAG: hypothetical protein J3K34DRAFT_202968 [Monoraphidium minutum]|nr:MAG: hypothetical protein J3K34DRAFT_202968 [Monoraphidium minutum]